MRSLDLYATFVEIAKHGSLSEAAQSLHISQPALSGKISELERELGVKLLFRTNRGIALTGEGQALLEHLRRGFAQIEAGENKLREIAGLHSGLLRIGASDMTLRFYLLDYLAGFRDAHPTVHLAVTNAPTPQTLAALRGGLIDFGVISEPVSAEEGRELELIPVREIRDIFVCSDKFSSLLGREVDESELSAVPLIMLGRETSTRRYLDSFFAPDSFTPSIELATSDLLLEFARRGLGVACIVEDFAIQELKSAALHRVFLKREIPPRRFLLAFSKKLPLPAAASRLVDELIADRRL